MSNSIVIPHLSDSPPPISNNISEDFDEECEDFVGSDALLFDNDNLSVPTSPKICNQLLPENYSNLEAINFQNDCEIISNNLKGRLQNESGDIIMDDTNSQLENIKNEESYAVINTEQNEIFHDFSKVSNELNTKSSNEHISEKHLEPFSSNCFVVDKPPRIDSDNKTMKKVAEKFFEFIVNENEDKFVKNKVFNDDTVKKDGKNSPKEQDLGESNSFQISDMNHRNENDEIGENIVTFEKFSVIEENIGDKRLDRDIKNNEIKFEQKLSQEIHEFNKFQTCIKDDNNDLFNKHIDKDIRCEKSADESSDIQNLKFSNSEDDFDEFSSFHNHSIEEIDEQKENLFQFSKFVRIISSEELCRETEIVVKNCFLIGNSRYEDYKCCDFTKNNVVFEYLKDITETQALKYQWEKSKAQENLLKTLNIDMRNIIFGPSWNAHVPATFSSVPLEPVRTMKPLLVSQENNETTFSDISNTSSQEFRDQFKRNNSQYPSTFESLVEPIGIEHFETDKSATSSAIITLDRESVTQEYTNVKLNFNGYSQKNNNTSGNLSENEFINSSLCNPNYELEMNYNKLLSLRESYISGQPTILNEEILLPEYQNQDLKMDSVFFSETDTTSLSTNSKIIMEIASEENIKPSKLILYSSQNHTDFDIFESKNEDLGNEAMHLEPFESSKIMKKGNFELEDDEFTDFHSSLPCQLSVKHSLKFSEPLKPAVLQPIIKNHQSLTNIEWPEPGLDEEEIDRIISGCLRTTSISKKSQNDCEPETVCNSREVINNEDDWSDFFSVQATHKPKSSLLDDKNTVLNGTTNSSVSIIGDVELNKRTKLSNSQEYSIENDFVDSVLNQNSLPTTILGCGSIKLPEFKKPCVTSIECNGQNSGGDFNNLAIVNHGNIDNISPMFSKSDAEIDEWSDFISAKNESFSSNLFSASVLNQYSTQFITNPRSNTKNKRINLTSNASISKNMIVRQERRNIPTISTLPDLEFISPNLKNVKK